MIFYYVDELTAKFELQIKMGPILGDYKIGPIFNEKLINFEIGHLGYQVTYASWRIARWKDPHTHYEG